MVKEGKGTTPAIEWAKVVAAFLLFAGCVGDWTERNSRRNSKPP
jgi:hypothetical protein